MKKQIQKPLLYNIAVAREINVLTEIIVDVYGFFDNLPWSNNSHYEIGFYYKNKTSKTSVFFGIYYDSWEFFGIPLCIAVDYKGKYPVEMNQKLKKLIESKTEKGVYFKDFNDLGLILFDHDYFNFEDDADRLSDLFEEISTFVDSVKF